MIKKVLENLKKNNMEAYLVETREEVVPLVEKLLPAGAVVSAGGSVTLAETGVMELLKSGRYEFLDRARPGITPEEVQQVYRDTFSADGFFCSANAITQQGELVNVDGNSNRISALLFGPETVIVVAGVNKIVTDAEAGFERIKRVAAPKNAVRLGCKTYCRDAGVCVAAEGGLATGCGSKERICRNYLVSGPQRIPGRIKVILVNEELGY
ncbi:MAG: lactate utilization protein [Clostridia bacterium]|nr:lactate utilization protein [Clostridia bacterium]